MIQRREINEFKIGHDSQSKARILWKNVEVLKPKLIQAIYLHGMK